MKSQEYNEFIKSIELKSIILTKIEAELIKKEFEPELNVDIQSKSTTTFTENNILFFTTFSLKIKKREKKFATITLTFLTKYSSKLKPEKELIDFFEKHSLLITLWPYLRFWVQTIIQSWGWPPLTLPLLKQIPKTNKNKNK